MFKNFNFNTIIVLLLVTNFVANSQDIRVIDNKGTIKKIHIVSTDPGNLIQTGTDGGTYLPPNFLDLIVKKETIGYTFSAGFTQGNNGTNLFNINSTVTRTSAGQYSIVFDEPHPNGSNYPIVLGVEEDTGNRDGRIIQVVDNSQTANGFRVMILTGDNGGTADAIVDENWSFEVTATITVVTDIDQNNTNTTNNVIGTEDTSGVLLTNNFRDTSTFDLTFRNTTNSPVNWEIILDHVPYSTIPNLNLAPGDYVLTGTSNNGDGTFKYLFTSVNPIAAFDNFTISGDIVSPAGNTFGGGTPMGGTTITYYTR